MNNNLDVVALIETWLGTEGSEGVAEGDLHVCQPGFNLVTPSCFQGRGGGVAPQIMLNLKGQQ